jgi:hypothetical protein
MGFISKDRSGAARQRLYFSAMLNTQEGNKMKSSGKAATSLATQGPLCEKDEQGMAIERTKILQKGRLKNGSD